MSTNPTHFFVGATLLPGDGKLSRAQKQRLLDPKEALDARYPDRPTSINPDEYDVYPRKNGWTYKGFQMETAITDTEDQCPYAFAAASYISLLTPSTRLVPMRRGRG